MLIYLLTWYYVSSNINKLVGFVLDKRDIPSDTIIAYI